MHRIMQQQIYEMELSCARISGRHSSSLYYKAIFFFILHYSSAIFRQGRHIGAVVVTNFAQSDRRCAVAYKLV